MTQEAARLRSIRASLDAIAPGEWSRACDDKGEFVEARGPMGELLPVARFHAGATVAEMTFMADAPGNVRFLLGLVDRAIRRARDAQPKAKPAPDPKDFAAEAAIKCTEPAFKAWLEEAHGLERPLTDDRAAQKLRSLLAITSRSELNSDAAAAERWRKLRGDFNAWLREQRR